MDLITRNCGIYFKIYLLKINCLDWDKPLFVYFVLRLNFWGNINYFRIQKKL